MRLRVLVALALLLASCCGLLAQDAVSILKKLDEGFSAVFEKTAPTVVVIEATKGDEGEGRDATYEFFFKDGEEGHRERDRSWKLPEVPSQSEGSGFIIRPNGYVVTNLHVVSGAESLEVRMFSGKRFPAKLVGSDERTDIAVIKIEAENLAVANLGDSEALKIGQLVCAIGAPFSQDYSFSCGWVSGKGRTDLLARSSTKLLYEDYIQTDAFINPGNSGGPLFDVEGRVVGMNTLINGLGRGLAFAIPSNLLKNVTDQLIADGSVRWPWLGVRITSLVDNKGLREQLGEVPNGVVVNTIEAESPAYQSDLQPGDVVTLVDGIPMQKAHDLVRHVQTKSAGDSMQFTVVRRGRTLTVPVKTGEQPAGLSRVAVPRPVPLPSDPEEGLGLNFVDTRGGAKVVGIEEKSPAAEAQLKVADVVTAVNAEPVASAKAAQDSIKAALSKYPEKGVLLNFLREGKKNWAVIERRSH